MIAAHLEPKGLDRDTPAIADFGAGGSMRYDAERGSERLLAAILKLNSKAAPKRSRTRLPERPCSWRDRQVAKAKILRIRCAVAEHFGRAVSDMIGKRGDATLCLQRQVAMFLARECTTGSYVDVGLQFGGRDHTTVIHACRQVEKRLEYDLRVRADVDHLRNAFAA